MNQFRRVSRKARYAKKNCVKPAVMAVCQLKHNF